MTWSKLPHVARQLMETLVVVGLPAVLISLWSDDLALYTWSTVAVYVLFAMGTNVLLGWSGSTSFGQAAYFGLGAYAVALLRDQDLNNVVLLPVAVVAAAIGALLLGSLTLTSTGLRFAVMTLVFGQLVYLIVFQSERLGSETGLYPVQRADILGVETVDQDSFYWLVVGVLAVAVFVLRRVHQSSFGLTLQAMRDDPLRAVACGLPIRWIRLGAFTFAGAVAGLAGGLFAQQQGSASPSMLSFTLSGHVVLICLLGGRLRFWGPALGAVVYTWAEYYLKIITESPDIWLGLLLLVIVIAMPDGLARLWDLGRWMRQAVASRRLVEERS